jgi:DNA-binding IscR family transcriptional regulator
MQLNKFTDYALRILMYVSRPSEMPYTIAEIALDLHVSQIIWSKLYISWLNKSGSLPRAAKAVDFV